jgi:hypothetical protein
MSEPEETTNQENHSPSLGLDSHDIRLESDPERSGLLSQSLAGSDITSNPSRPTSRSETSSISHDEHYPSSSKRRATEDLIHKRSKAQYTRLADRCAVPESPKTTSSISDNRSLSIDNAPHPQLQMQPQPQPQTYPPQPQRLSFQEWYAQYAKQPPKVYTYKHEPHTPRNQQVLGLKYIHDKHGRPRRIPQSRPTYIDKVSLIHVNSDTNTVKSPPGLNTRRGQFTHDGTDRVEEKKKKYLCQYRHHRLRLEVDEVVYGGMFRKDSKDVEQ